MVFLSGFGTVGIRIPHSQLEPHSLLVEVAVPFLLNTVLHACTTLTYDIITENHQEGATDSFVSEYSTAAQQSKRKEKEKERD
jgi:hypothetical protein